MTVLSFDHQVCFHILITSLQLREAICHFSHENVVPISHEQNIICSKTLLDGTTHEQTIICRQLFEGHLVDSRPMERKKNTHRTIITFICSSPEKRTSFPFQGLGFGILLDILLISWSFCISLSVLL